MPHTVYLLEEALIESDNYPSLTITLRPGKSSAKTICIFICPSIGWIIADFVHFI